MNTQNTLRTCEVRLPRLKLSKPMPRGGCNAQLRLSDGWTRCPNTATRLLADHARVCRPCLATAMARGLGWAEPVSAEPQDEKFRAMSTTMEVPVEEVPKWSDKAVLRRLRNIASDVPGAGFGTQSATISGISSFAVDAAAWMELNRKVLDGVLAPRPHPEFGDDGYQDARRQEALEALAWGEQWIVWRKADQWGRRVCDFGSKPWKTTP